MRAAIYARYSSENQREVSIDDQIRICKARVKAEEWSLTATYTDAAISGATRMRAGYLKLLEDARAGEFDVVVAEALDRLSRDQEDVAALYKHLSLRGGSCRRATPVPVPAVARSRPRFQYRACRRGRTRCVRRRGTDRPGCRRG